MTSNLELFRIVSLWNSTFNYDPTIISELRRRFFNSRLISPIYPSSNDGAFSLLGVRKTDFYYEKMDKSKGWILASGFKSKTDFLKLIDTQEKKAKYIGVKEIYYSNFTPDYYFPGIDIERYGELYDTLRELGFETIEYAISMEAYIDKCTYTQHSLYSINYINKNDDSQLLNFIKGYFSPDWYHRAYYAIKYGQKEQISVAKINNTIVGYGMFSAGSGKKWYQPGERFGPFGVAPQYRSKGIGTQLLSFILCTMKSLGIKYAYFLWTDEKASHLYSRFGFTKTRIFAIMKKYME